MKILFVVVLLFTFNSLLFSQELITTHDDNSNITGIYFIEASYFDCTRNVIEGEIIKVNYDESEVYINLVVIEDNEQNRIQIRIDPNIENRMANADKGKLYQFLKKGKTLYFDCNICGSGNIYSVRNIYISKSEAIKYSDELDLISHNVFDNFFRDFKLSVKTKNIKNIINMTNMPFIDFNGLVYRNPNYSATDRISFSYIFDEIFGKSVIDICNNKTPIKLTKEDFQNYTTEAEKKYNIEYYLYNDVEPKSLAFGKINGVYKLIGLRYME